MTRPACETTGRLVGEVERCRQQDQVLQSVVWPQGRVQRADQRAQAPPEHAELVAAGNRLEFADDARQILERVVVKRQILVLGSGCTPVEQIQVVPVPQHVLGETVSGPQVEHMRPVHDREHHQQRNAFAFCGGDDRDVAVQLGLVERPDDLFGRLGDLRVGGQQTVEAIHVLGDLVPGSATARGTMAAWESVSAVDVAVVMSGFLPCGARHETARPV